MIDLERSRWLVSNRRKLKPVKNTHEMKLNSSSWWVVFQISLTLLKLRPKFLWELRMKPFSDTRWPVKYATCLTRMRCTSKKVWRRWTISWLLGCPGRLFRPRRWSITWERDGSRGWRILAIFSTKFRWRVCPMYQILSGVLFLKLLMLWNRATVLSKNE